MHNLFLITSMTTSRMRLAGQLRTVFDVNTCISSKQAPVLVGNIFDYRPCDIATAVLQIARDSCDKWTLGHLETHPVPIEMVALTKVPTELHYDRDYRPNRRPNPLGTLFPPVNKQWGFNQGMLEMILDYICDIKKFKEFHLIASKGVEDG